jgi:hypothetical protein
MSGDEARAGGVAAEGYGRKRLGAGQPRVEAAAASFFTCFVIGGRGGRGLRGWKGKLTAVS